MRGGQGRRTENYSRDFALGREVSVTRQHAPVVRRVTVAIAVRKTGARRSNQEMQALERLVQSAVGYDLQRGDVVTIDARSFAPVASEESSWMDNPWLAVLLRNLAAIVVCAMIIFGLGRPLLKWRAATKDHAAVALSNAPLGASRSAHSETQSLTKISLDLIDANRDFETRASLIRGFVRQDPARAAVVVRDLIGTGGKDGRK